jgi:hypothetical protein
VTGTATESFCNPTFSEAMLLVKSRIVNNGSLIRAAVRPLQTRSFKGHYVNTFPSYAPLFPKIVAFFFALSPFVRATSNLR